MSGTYRAVMGDRGRLVIPAELRKRAGFSPGTVLILAEIPNGVAMATRDQIKDQVRQDLAGPDLVGELLAERRRQSQAEDVA